MTKINFVLTIILAGIFLTGCSSVKETAKKSNEKSVYNEEMNLSAGERHEQAMDHFITGSIYEVNEDYPSAIIEFQDALRFEQTSGIYYALAKNYYYLDKIPFAVQNANKSIQLDSSNIDYYYLLSDILSSASQFDSAAVVLNKLIKLDSTQANAYYKLARIYENSKPLQAIEIYEKLTDVIGPEWNVLIHVGELYDKMGKLDKAANSIKQLLTIDPGNSSLQKLLAQYYERDKKYDDALKILNEILELTPNDLDARQQKAKVYLDQNDWESASKEYSYILNQPKVPLDAKIGIGVSYFNEALKDSSLFPIAEKFFHDIDKDTLDWRVKMYLGAIALSQNNDSLAINNFEKVTKMASWNVQAWIRLGGLYFDNQKYHESVKVMQEAIKSFPEDFTVNLILGLALDQSDKNHEATPYLKKAVDLNPNDITALSAYGYNLNEISKPKDAISYLKKALEIKPDDVNLLGTLGLIYNAQKMYTECDSVYEKALELDSTNALVNNNYAYSLSERGKDLERALKMVNLALKADSNNSSYLDTKGWIFYKMKKYPEAKEYINKAIKSGGERAEILEHLGDVEFMMGKKETAQELWKKAYNLDSTNNELKLKIEKGEI